MKYLLICITLLFGLSLPASASQITAPEPPQRAQQFMPVQQESFAEGLWYVLRSALETVHPDIAQATKTCTAVIAASILVSILGSFSGVSKGITELAATVAVSLILLSGVRGLIYEGAHTVQQLSEYGKLLLPVMTAALAAQGGYSASATIYTATALFDAVLSAVISKILIPLVYVFLVLSIVNSSLEEEMLKKLRDFIKWLVAWALKTILYVFTGYIAVTGVVSGTADQTALRATKLTIAGMVPVVGGILSDASEAVLVGAGVVKNTAGIYGLLAIASIIIGPFLRIGVHYLLLKLTAGVCSVFSEKKLSVLVNDFSAGMGQLLAMTGSVCLLLMISTVCLMKGMS